MVHRRVALGASLLVFVVLAMPALGAGGPIVGAPLKAAVPVTAAEDFPRGDVIGSLLNDLRQRFGKELDPSYQAAVKTKLMAVPLEELTAHARAHDVAFVVNSLGASSSDLVYNRISPPCRIFDSRPSSGIQGQSTGPLVAATKVALDVAAGIASGCGVPFPLAKAAVLNFVVVAPSGPRDLRAWPWDNTAPAPPTASLVNYTAVTGLNLANGLVVPLCDTTTATGADCDHDLFVQPDVHGAHLVIDVLGYFSAPAATALDCERLSAPFSAAVGTQFNIGSPACDAGYILTSGGINLDQGWVSGDELLGSNPFSSQWECQGSTVGATFGAAWSPSSR